MIILLIFNSLNLAVYVMKNKNCLELATCQLLQSIQAPSRGFSRRFDKVSSSSVLRLDLAI